MCGFNGDEMNLGKRRASGSGDSDPVGEGGMSPSGDVSLWL